MNTVLQYHVVMEQLPAPFRLINTMINAKGDVTVQGSVLHRHAFYHVNYILEGQLTICFKNHTYAVAAGQAFILPPEIPHRLYSDSGYAQIGIDIAGVADEKGLYRMLEDACQNRCIVTCPFSVITNYSELTELLQTPTQSNMLMVYNIAENTLLRALKNIRGNGKTAFEQMFQKLLQDHDFCRLTLSNLSDLMGYSRAHLERMAQRTFGCGAVEYLNRMKLIRICTLLVSSDLPIAQIAEKINFYDASHLTVFFKKRIGMSPAAYRKANRIRNIPRN